MDNKSHKLWPLIGYTQFNDYEIVDYDYLYFNDYQALVARFEELKDSKKNIIIDKHEEQLTDKNDPLANQLGDLNYFLKTYKCKTRSVVFDNTHDDHFFHKHQMNHLSAPFYMYYFLNPITGIKIPNWDSKISHTFVCVNNTHRPHRQKFVEGLSQNNILPKTKWSYRQKISSKIIQTPKFLDEADNNLFKPNSPIFETFSTLYQHCFIALVTEGAFYQSNITSITEKSLFPIFYGCIPLIVGLPGSVNLLRSWGIDMYDDIVDHSYDNVIDPDQRLQMIIDQCKQWVSERYPQKIKNLIAPRILRNQILLTSRDYWKNQIRRIMYDYKY